MSLPVGDRSQPPAPKYLTPLKIAPRGQTLARTSGSMLTSALDPA